MQLTPAGEREFKAVQRAWQVLWEGGGRQGPYTMFYMVGCLTQTMFEGVADKQRQRRMLGAFVGQLMKQLDIASIDITEPDPEEED